MHIARFATDEGPISFDGPRHPVECTVMLRAANTVQHEPSGLLRRLQRSGDLVRRYAILAVRKHPHRIQPLVESNWAILGNRADFNRELPPASETRPHQPCLEKRHLFALAAWAYNAIRPLHFPNGFNADQRVRNVTYGGQQTAVFIEVNRFRDLTILLGSMRGK